MLATGMHTALAAALAALALGCGSVSGRDDDGGGSEDGDDGGGDEGGDDGGGGPVDGGDDGAAPDFTCEGRSGDRLRQVIRRHDDGSSERVKLFDSELELPCEFTATDDGAVRCVPIPDRDQMPTFIQYYTDAGCGDAIAVFGTEEVGAAPRYASYIPIDASPGCAPRRRYVELGAEMAIPGGMMIYRRSELGCTGQLASPEIIRIFALGSELPNNRFVAGAETWNGAGRIAMRAIDGDDGSRYCQSDLFRDRELGDHPCVVKQDEAGELRCLPQAPLLSGGVSTTDTCEDSIAVSQVPDDCDVGMDYVHRPAFEGCLSRTQVHERGAARAEPLFFNFSDDPDFYCVPVPEGYTYHDVGPAVPPSTLAPLAEVVDTAGGRLQRIGVDGDGVSAPRPLWRDTELDVTCEFQPAADGIERCLPGPVGREELGPANPFRVSSQGLVVTLFADLGPDAGCNGASGSYVIYQDGGCDAETTVRYAIDREQSPQPTFRVFRAGKQVTQALRYMPGCKLVPPGIQVHELGPEVALSEFVAGVEEIE